MNKYNQEIVQDIEQQADALKEQPAGDVEQQLRQPPAMDGQGEVSKEKEPPLTGNSQWKALYRELAQYAKELKQ